MRHVYKIFELIAQVVGTTFSLYVIVYIIRTRFNPFSFNVLELMVSISISIVWIGIVAGLQYKRLGAGLSWSGVLLFMLTIYWVSGSLPGIWLLSSLALPGSFYIATHLLKSVMRQS